MMPSMKRSNLSAASIFNTLVKSALPPALLAVLATGSSSGCTPPKPADARLYEITGASRSLKVEINHLQDGVLPKEYLGSTCGGDNKSIALRWSDPPSGTKSYALLFIDADSTGPKAQVQWGVADLPASVTSLGTGESTALASSAIELVQDTGKTVYAGPCPPSTTHHYTAIVYAVSVASLGLPKSATAADLSAALATKTLAYGRAGATASK
jgi:Raf kinase inhibitor-like YbhB/YbcL family protein